jgi:hypothetical protein
VKATLLIADPSAKFGFDGAMGYMNSAQDMEIAILHLAVYAY